MHHPLLKLSAYEVVIEQFHQIDQDRVWVVGV